MKVDKFELVSWISGMTTAEISGVYSYKLFINEQEISNNLSELEFNDGKAQLNICEECFIIGCASRGYVKVILLEDIIIFKNLDREMEDDETLEAIYENGAFFWKKEIFTKLLNSYNVSYKEFEENVNKELSHSDAIDLWLLGANCSLKRKNRINIEETKNSILTVFSQNKSDDEAEAIFKKAVELMLKHKTSRIITDNYDTLEKLTVIFNNAGYSEWDCLYLKQNKILFNLGDGYLLEIE